MVPSKQHSLPAGCSVVLTDEQRHKNSTVDFVKSQVV